MDSFHEIDGRPAHGADGKAPIARARLLGAFTLTDLSDRDLSGVARKVRAVLAYLILADGRPVPRQELMAFAWSDRGPEQARASLRQGLHEARRLLASSLLIVDRAAVRLDTSQLDTDLRCLLDHARADRLAELAQDLGQWRAPLLADLDGIDAHIDRWLTDARRRWADEIHAEVSACVSRMRDSASPDDLRPLTAFLARLRPATQGVANSSGPKAQPADKPARRWRWPILAAAVVTFAAIALALGYGLTRAHGDDILLVEPLQAAASDQPAQTVRAGLSGDLARVMAGKPAGLEIAQSDGRDQGRPHGRLTLAGDATTTGDQLRVHIQLRDADTHSILWSQNFAGPPSEAETLHEQVATKLGSVLNCALSTRHRGAAAIGDQAAVLYLRACDLIGDYDLDGALDLLRQVTVLAPGFARAWADLGVTQSLVAEDLPLPQRLAADSEANKNALHALQIDPRTGLAYFALARTQSGIASWAKRVATIQKGLQVEPDSSELNNIMGQELMRVGRSAEGLLYLQRSRDLDSLNPVKAATLIGPLANYGDIDGAEALAAQARTLWPKSVSIWTAVFTMESRVGDPRKALAMLHDPQRPRVKTEDDIQRWETVLRVRLDPTPSNIEAAVSESLRRAAQSPDDDPMPTALTIARWGRTDVAYRLIAGSKTPAYEGYDEWMFRDGLAAFRADQRFMPLAAQRGLVAIWRSTGHWPDVCSQSPAPPGCPAASR